MAFLCKQNLNDSKQDPYFSCCIKQLLILALWTGGKMKHR